MDLVPIIRFLPAIEGSFSVQVHSHLHLETRKKLLWEPLPVWDRTDSPAFLS